MCATGKVKYIGSGANNLTADSEYDIITFAALDSGHASAIIVDDLGKVIATGALDGTSFEVTSLTSSTVVI